MKKGILICLFLFTAFMIFGIEAVVQYHGEAFAYYTTIPSGYTSEWGERFTATANVTLLKEARFYFYPKVGTFTSIQANVYSATTASPPLPNALLGSVTVPASAFVPADDYTTISLSSLGLSFRSGDEFFITYSIVGGSYDPTSYATTGGLGILATAYGTSNRSVRYRRPTVVPPGTYVWSAYTAAGWDMGISAVVDYEIEHDAELTNVNFYGTYTLPLADMVYDCDVQSNGLTETNVPVRLRVYNAATSALLFTNTKYVASLGATPVNVVFDAYSYTAAGRYNVEVATLLTGDQLPSNDSYMFEQQAVADYPATISYDDGTCENAYVLTNTIGGGFVSWFYPPYLPYQITDVRYFLYDNTWPAPGGTEFRVVIYDDDGDGNGPGTELYNQVVNGTRGVMNIFDVSNSNIVLQDGSFFVGYIFTQIGTASPGLGCDDNPPIAGENVTYELVADTLYLTGITNTEFMINATVAYPKPVNMTITKETGGTKVGWDAINGGGIYTYTYTVKSGLAPNAITTTETTTSNNYWLDTAPSPRKFYRVTATSAELKGGFTPRSRHIDASPININAGATQKPLHYYQEIND
jgi:hypothetical protein